MAHAIPEGRVALESPSDFPSQYPVPDPAPKPHPASDEADAFHHSLVVDLMLNPARWKIWPAIAILRWLQAQLPAEGRLNIVFCSLPSLSFAPSEIHDIGFRDGRLEVVLNVLGVASSGSPLPSSDVARIIEDMRRGGAIAAWLDALTDRFAHVAESAMLQHSGSFSAVRGEEIEAMGAVVSVVGHDAPLSSDPDGSYYANHSGPPRGALSLAGLFLGPPSSAGLSTAMSGVTGLQVRVREFAGGRIQVARPARLGHRMGAILGRWCDSVASGVEVVLEAGDDADAALVWARDPVRLESLHHLAASYVGSPSPEVRIELEIDAAKVPGSALGEDARLGGLRGPWTWDRYASPSPQAGLVSVGIGCPDPFPRSGFTACVTVSLHVICPFDRYPLVFDKDQYPVVFPAGC